jgi:hypothetical protein
MRKCNSVGSGGTRSMLVFCKENDPIYVDPFLRKLLDLVVQRFIMVMRERSPREPVDVVDLSAALFKL